jgi:hypothetical protein
MAVKAKTTPKVSLVKNPAKGKLTVKRTTAVKRRKRRTNPTAKVVKVRRRVVKRNPAMGELVGAFATAIVINSFDIVINRFFPSLSGLVRTAAKFGGGWAVGKFGSRLPVIGTYSRMLSYALYLAGALDVVQTYVMPPLVSLLMPAPMQPAPMPVMKQLPSGELGESYRLPNGDEVIVIDDSSNNDNSMYNNNPYGLQFV